MIQSKTVRLKLIDDDPKSLGCGNLTADIVTCPEGLIEGQHFMVRRPSGVVIRLRPFGRELYTFTYQYDDLAEQIAESEAVDHTNRADARSAIVNMQTYVDLATPTNAQTITIVKLLCRVIIILVRHLFIAT